MPRDNRLTNGSRRPAGSYVYASAAGAGGGVAGAAGCGDAGGCGLNGRRALRAHQAGRGDEHRSHARRFSTRVVSTSVRLRARRRGLSRCSSSTNVVATQSTVIVELGSGFSFARIAMLLTLMIRENLLTRSKNIARL